MDKLIKLLFENARYTNADLASMLDTTEEEIAQRIQKLEQDGVINGYKALVNWEKTCLLYTSRCVSETE